MATRTLINQRRAVSAKGIARVLAMGILTSAMLGGCAAQYDRVQEDLPHDDALASARITRIYLKQTKANGQPVSLAEGASGEVDRVMIDARAGTAELQAVAVYTDGNEEVLSNISWHSDDPQVVRASGAGLITARSDGQARITATLDNPLASPDDDEPNEQAGSAENANSTLSASLDVIVEGQQTNPYVTSIAISSQREPESPLSVYLNEGADIYSSMVAFYAIVETCDPVTGEAHRYNTHDGTLFEQSGGRIADLSWRVIDNDTSSAAVQDSAGTALFIPLAPASVELVASSEAGNGNTEISCSVDVVSKAPAGEADPDINHPQESLDIYCYWQDYPPTDEEKHDPQGSDKFVIQAHYTPEELAALGMAENRYTLIRNSDLDFSALYAQGPYIETLLSDVFFASTDEQLASLSVDAVSSLTFFCYDGLYGRAVSGPYLLQTDEYYYPLIYTDDPAADAQLVKPELALFSFKTANDNITEYSDDGFFAKMDEANRFRLALGANLDEMVSNQQLAVKWVNTIFVELKGGPATQTGDGDAPAQTETGAGAAPSAQSPVQSAEGSGESFRIYQVMNHFDPVTDSELDYANPYLGAAAALALACFCAGGVSAGIWARQQRRSYASRAASAAAQEGDEKR